MRDGLVALVLLVGATGLLGLALDRDDPAAAERTLSMRFTAEEVAFNTAWGFSQDGLSGWVIPYPNGHVDAFWSRSPHLGCAAHPVHRESAIVGGWIEPAIAEGVVPEDTPGAFFEECSNSRWAWNGERLYGPAPRGLDRFPTDVQRTAGGGLGLTIDLSRVILGACSAGIVPADGTTIPCSEPGAPQTVDAPRPAPWNPHGPDTADVGARPYAWPPPD